MRIGVDAGALSITDDRLKVGVYRVTYNLLRELSKIDKKNEYRLYSFLPIEEKVMQALGPRMKNVVIRPSTAWATIRLPIELRLRPVDVFLGLSQMLPPGPQKNIGFIYDLGFLHNPGAYPGSLNKLKMYTKQTVDRAAALITISETSRNDIQQAYGTATKKITVAYPGIDTRFTPKGVVHKEKHPYILCVGALKRGKNIPFALEVFKKILEKSDKPYNLVLVGGNYWEDPEVHERIKKLNLTPRVKFTGFVPDDELPSYYRGARALLITSLWEGFCLPAAEAMACGVPVVYARVGSLPEVVASSGVVFLPENLPSAVDALMSVIENGSIRRDLAAEGLKLSFRYTWPTFAKDVYRIMRE